MEITTKNKNKKSTLVSLREYALNHNPKLNRRGFTMSESYLYRLIRENMNGHSRELWFKYILEGDKNHILIEL